MRVALKIVGGIVVCAVVLLVVLRFTGFEPKLCPTASTLACKAPGLWLRGDAVTTPVTDWSFTNQVQTIKVQTESPILLPYSVAAYCAVYNGNLYLTSYPERRWVKDLVQDPHGRLKIGDQLYDRNFVLVTDPAEKEAVLQAKGKKYPHWKVPPADTTSVFRVTAG